MAVARRPILAELVEGTTDGSHKKVVRDRGGVIDGSTWLTRSQLDDYYYGIHELRAKVLPDGTVAESPDYVATPPPNMLRW